VADGAGEIFIDQDGGLAKRRIDGPALGPRDTRIGPTPDNDIAIPVEAESPVAAAQGRRLVRAVEKSNAVGYSAWHLLSAFRRRFCP
jgi:hypothetical protein